MRARYASLLFVAILASSVTAQIGIGRIKTDNLPGDAVLPPGAVNITEIALAGFGNNGSALDDIQGVARLPNGHYIVSQGYYGLVPNQYFELDANGDWVGAIQQPFNIGNAALNDLAWDGKTGADSRLWAGFTKSIMSFDWQNSQFPVPPILPGSENGLHGLESFVGRTVRAAAIADIDGLKVLISADSRISRFPDVGYDHSDINYHVMGVPLPDFPTLKPATPFAAAPLEVADLGKLGAAYDPIRGTIWWEIDLHRNSPNPNHSAVRFMETDLDGNLTGQVVQGIREIGGVARGCELYIDAEGNRVMVYVTSMGDTLATSPLGITKEQDIMVEMYMAFQFGSSCGGNIGFETEPYIGNLNWTVTLENAPSNPLNAAILFRGTADPVGFMVPGINNCQLLMSLANFRNMGALPLANGEASFVQNLPDDINLVGLEATFQWLLPSNLNVLPLNLSDAGAVRIGSNL